MNYLRVVLKTLKSSSRHFNLAAPSGMEFKRHRVPEEEHLSRHIHCRGHKKCNLCYPWGFEGYDLFQAAC